jgi:hypothetical protein
VSEDEPAARRGGLEMLESVPGSIVDTATQYVGTMNEILPSGEIAKQLPVPFRLSTKFSWTHRFCVLNHNRMK